MKKHWLLKIDSRLFVRRILPTLAVAALVLWSAIAVSPGKTLDVYFLDVGQGDAIYGRLPTGEDFLVDGGPDDKILSQLGEVMPPWDKEINLIVASHNHADHIKGLIGVLGRYKAGEIWISGAVHTTQTYLNFLEAIKKEKEQGAEVKAVKAGDNRDLGQAKMLVLSPADRQQGSEPDDQHDATVVTRLSYGEVDYLFAGDLNEEHERGILNYQLTINHSNINSEVLKIPHHGSATGLLEEFLDAVKPKYAVIQVGKGNQFGHPAPSVLDKLKSRSIPYYRNDANGRIEISTDGKNIFVKTQK